VRGVQDSAALCGQCLLPWRERFVEREKKVVEAARQVL